MWCHERHVFKCDGALWAGSLLFVILQLIYLCFASSGSDEQTTIKGASSIDDLYPFITELITIDEWKNILLNKYKSQINVNENVPKHKKIGGITLPKQQLKLKQLKIEQKQLRQELDSFLSHNNLSNIFNYNTFLDHHITLDIIKYDNNRLNYTINDVADIICNDGSDTKTYCSDFNKLRLMSSIVKVRNTEKMNFNSKKMHEMRTRLVKKDDDDINKLNQPHKYNKK